MKFDMLVKNIKNIQSSNQISQIYNHINFFVKIVAILYFIFKKKRDHYLAKNNL